MSGGFALIFNITNIIWQVFKVYASYLASLFLSSQNVFSFFRLFPFYVLANLSMPSKLSRKAWFWGD